MWARNLAFGALCLLAAGGLSASLLDRDRIQPPAGFAPADSDAWGIRDVVDQINDEFQSHWDEVGVEAAPQASTLAAARRLSLGLTGTIPSLEEIRALERQPEGDRLAWWLSRILEDRRYADYVAERLARSYVGTENGPFLVYRRRRFVVWLSDHLHENTPYDLLVRQMIGESGLWTDTPAVNFVTVTLDQNESKQPDPIRLAARTSRAFLGLRIDCLQCHDDRLGRISFGTEQDPRDGLQSDFHQLAAFFAETQNSLAGVHDAESRQYKYKYLDSPEEEVVAAQVPFLSELVDPREPLRQQLAGWVTHPENRPFGRAMVNRTWALMFGRPLVEPIDDIPLHGEFPPAMETLTEDFIAHGYDLRRLIRVIAATDVFRLDSRADHEITSRHEQHWAAFPLTRLRPEQVAGGAIQSASLKTIDANAHIVFQLLRYTKQNDFIKRYGDTGEDEFTERGGTITQRLIMMNGELIKNHTKSAMFTASARIASLTPDDQRAVESAYLAVLSRRPSPQEQQHFSARLAEAKNERRRHQIMEDLFWTLLNSSEFCWNH